MFRAQLLDVSRNGGALALAGAGHETVAAAVWFVHCVQPVSTREIALLDRSIPRRCGCGGGMSTLLAAGRKWP